MDSVQNLNIDSTLSLKVIFAGHFALTTFAMMGKWLPDSYMFYNAFFLVFVIWSQLATTDSDFPLLNGFIVNVFGIVADILIMSANYPNPSTGIQKFGLAMAVFNLLGRIPSSFLLYRIRDQRKTMLYGGVGEPRPGLAGYEDLPSGFNDRADVHSPIDTKPLAP